MVSPENLDDVTAMGIASVEVVTRVGGKKDEDGNPHVESLHRIRLHDKKGALDTLAKHLGILSEPIEHTGVGGKELIPMSDLEVARHLAFLLTAADTKS